MLDLKEALIFGLESAENGSRVVHFYGYGYDTDGDGFRFLEYCGFLAPLEQVLKTGFEKYEEENGAASKCSVADMDSYEDLVDTYLAYDGGKQPALLREGRISSETPDGIYILC